MAIRSLFRTPDMAVLTGIALGGVTALFYTKALPNLTDVRLAPANDNHVENVRKHAALTSAGLIIGVSAVTRDANVFIIAGTMFFLTDYMVKHQNGFNPQTGKLEGNNTTPGIAEDSAQYHPLPEYSQAS